MFQRLEKELHCMCRQFEHTVFSLTSTPGLLRLNFKFTIFYCYFVFVSLEQIYWTKINLGVEGGGWGVGKQGWLGRDSKEFGRGSNELGRGSNDQNCCLTFHKY